MGAERDVRRRQLIQVLATVPATRVPTSMLVLDVSRVDEARLGTELDSFDFERLTAGNPAHIEDALLAITARSIGAEVVSQDRDLHRMAAQLEISSLSVKEFEESLCSLIALPEYR